VLRYLFTTRKRVHTMRIILSELTVSESMYHKLFNYLFRCTDLKEKQNQKRLLNIKSV